MAAERSANGVFLDAIQMLGEVLTDACELSKDTAVCLLDESRSLYKRIRGRNKKVTAHNSCFWIILPQLVRFNVMRDYLDVRSIVRLNTACTNTCCRADVLSLYKNMPCVALNRHVYRSKDSVNWVVNRHFSINRWNLRVTIPSSMTSFQWVCQQQMITIAEQMLHFGDLDPNAYSHYPGLSHMNPLAFACLQHHTEVVDMLLRSDKVLVDSCDMYGKTPLLNSCMQGSVPMIRRLLKAGACCNTRDNKFCTPLMHATRLNVKEGVRLLLEHGAIANLKNDEGQSALEIAQQYAFPPPEVVNMLQAADAGTESREKHLQPQEWPLNVGQLLIMAGLLALTAVLLYTALKLIEFFAKILTPSYIWTWPNRITVFGVFCTIKMLVIAGVGTCLAAVTLIIISGGGVEAVRAETRTFQQCGQRYDFNVSISSSSSSGGSSSSSSSGGSSSIPINSRMA